MATSAARITSGSKGWMTTGRKTAKDIVVQEWKTRRRTGTSKLHSFAPKELLRLYGWEHWQLKETRTRHEAGGLMARHRAIEDCEQRIFVCF